MKLRRYLISKLVENDINSMLYRDPRAIGLARFFCVCNIAFSTVERLEEHQGTAPGTIHDGMRQSPDITEERGESEANDGGN